MSPVVSSTSSWNKGRSRTLPRSKRNFVGPGVLEECLAGEIASCDCDVLQTEPDCRPALKPQLYSETPKPQKATQSKSEVLWAPKAAERKSESPKSQTLLPTTVTRRLFVWRDKAEGEYHLTVVRLDKEEVFLDLPLSGLLTGTLLHEQTDDFWHVVTVCENDRIHRIVFSLIISAGSASLSEAENFSKKLKAVIKDITTNPTTVSQETEEGQASAMQRAQGPTFGAEASAVGAGDIMPGLRKPQMPLSVQTAKQVSIDLASAILAGNVKKAQDLSALLAQGFTHVDVIFDTDTHEKKASEQQISVTVHVEDRESAGIVLTDIKVRPSDTIMDLKRMFLGKYSFPLEVQKWIIGNRICGNDETLSKCEVKSSGHKLYLYLLSAHAVNLSHDDFKRQWQMFASPGANFGPGSARPRSDSEYETLNFPTGLSPAGGVQDLTLPSPQGFDQRRSSSPGGAAVRQQSQLSATSSSNSLAAGSASSFGLTDLRTTNLESSSELGSGQRGVESGSDEGPSGALINSMAGLLVAEGSGPGDMRPKDRPISLQAGLLMAADPTVQLHSQEISPQGWQCESCTLINQPTRPGCEACGSARPLSYRVPQGYVVSEEERKRLELEKQQEAIMQQTSQQAWSEELGQGGRVTLPLGPNQGQHPPASVERLTPQQIDTILQCNDAIQEQMAQARREQAQNLARRGPPGQGSPFGVREVGGVRRQPVQNSYRGEDVPDNLESYSYLGVGWASEEEEEGEEISGEEENSDRENATHA